MSKRGVPVERDDDGGHTVGDRGLSDVVAFVLTFSIIIASVAIVSTTGLGQLTELRDNEQIQNAERSMQATAVELDSVRRGDPFQVLEFGVKDGSVWVNESELTVNVTTTDGDVTVHNLTVNAIEHRLSRPSNDVTIAYEAGAVMRSDGGTLRYRPEWHVDNRTAILAVVTLTATDTIYVASGFRQEIAIGPNRNIPRDAPVVDPDNTVQIAAERNASRTTTLVLEKLPAGTTANVTVNVSDVAHPEPWKQYLERTGWQAVEDRRHAYRAVAINDTVLIRGTAIDIS